MSVINNTTIWCIPAVQRSNKWEHKLNCNIIWSEEHKILSCIWSRVIQTSTSITTTTNNTVTTTLSPSAPRLLAIYLSIIPNKAAKGHNYTFTSHNMQQSARSGTQLQFHRNSLWLTAVHWAAVNWTVQTAVRVQTEKADIKRKVTRNSEYFIFMY